MNVVSAGRQKEWRTAREQSQLALEVVLLDRTYVLPWSQFLYAEGGEDEVRLAFAMHDVIVRGSGLGALLADVAAHRLAGVDEPSRAERFGAAGAERCVREVYVKRVG